MKIEFNINGISKKFGSQILFSELKFSVTNSSSLCIIGRNGSGKSTLLKILSNLIQPDSGTISMSIENMIIEKSYFYKYIGFISPYLNLYDELTFGEHIKFITGLRKEEINSEYVNFLKDGFMLDAGSKTVKHFSSGMKQKLKYIIGLMFKPKILIIDEPFTNLDSNGIIFLEEVLTEYIKTNALIIASNDIQEQRISTEFLKIGE